MFASSGLFVSFPCPHLPACPREAFCIFRHAMPSSTRQMPEEETIPSTRKHAREEATMRQTNALKPAPSSAVELSKKPRQTPGGKTQARHLTAPGPPVLKMDPRAHSKPGLRQAVVSQYYNEFLRIYAPLDEVGPALASTHAVDQEKAVHSKTNQGSYRNLAATVLQRLKKRGTAMSNQDVGIDGEWVDSSLHAKEELTLHGIWQQADRYVQTVAELDTCGYPVTVPLGFPPSLDPVQTCDRCKQRFHRISTLTEEDMVACHFHVLRLRTTIKNGEKSRHFACCGALPGTLGCCQGPHVFKEDSLSSLHGRIPFVSTPKADPLQKDRLSVIAMDCEMCYTMQGFEMIRLSVVDQTGKLVLDELVKPFGEVVDLNTRFSGISSLEDAKLSLEEARSKLLDLINDNTIVIGHSLENDFKVLRLIHKRVIDTALLYRHPRHNSNYRFSLQQLAREHLHINIQDSENGHDSYIDAKTCLDLVLLKIRLQSVNSTPT